MVYACCVPSCNNDGKIRNISLHSFTKDPALGKRWIKSIDHDTQMCQLKQRQLTVTKYTKICSVHFKKTDYSVGSGFNRLKQDAVPTIFPWTSKRISHQARAKQKESLLKSLEELKQLRCKQEKQKLELNGKAKYSSSDRVLDLSLAPAQENSSDEDDCSVTNSIC